MKLNEMTGNMYQNGEINEVNVFYKSYSSTGVPTSKGKLYNVLDSLSLALSFHPPFFLSSGTLSQECFHSQGYKKKLYWSVCACLCVFVCLHAHVLLYV